MTTSIRKFLLVNLLLSVVLITSITMLANLLLENKDLQRHLDDKLAQTAFAIQAFMSQAPSPLEMQRIQANLHAISTAHSSLYLHNKAQYSTFPREELQLEVINAQDRTLFRSVNPLPPTFLHSPPGFSSQFFQNKTWRIFVSLDPSNRIRVIVAEPYNFRNLFTEYVTQESLFIMLISYPFLGLLIWLILGRGLHSLQRVANEVQRRAPDHLEPIKISQVPIEIKTIVQEWNKLFLRLQQAFQREKRFAADAAHELKTPLAALRAQAQVALNANDEQERERALRKILVGVDRSAHVIQQLLILSRMGSGLALEQAKPVSIVRQAKEVIADLVPDALEKNTEIELVAPEFEPFIMGHMTAITILIRNLVDNAIRYTPENSFVRVEVKEAENETILSVIDNGPGIPEHLRNQVFERFYRVLGNKSTGSGLGLGIVQQIAELHKATITLATPSSGQGLQITLVFPKP